jgi:DNA-binding NarL/FixJ family response regulator
MKIRRSEVSRIVVYTDEPVLSLGIRELLGAQKDIELLGLVTEFEEAVRLCAAQQPEIALLSHSARLDRTQLTRFRRECPATAPVLWVNEIAPELAHQALELGARGILRRNLSIELTLKCIRKVSEGELWCEKSLASACLSGRSVSLSNRESQIVALLTEGQKNKEIATRLSISEGTVKVYLSKLFAKVGAKDRYELALFGLRNSQDAHSALPAGPSPGLRSLFIVPDESGAKKATMGTMPFPHRVS